MVQAGAKAVMAERFFFVRGFLDADNQVGVMETIVMRMDKLAKSERAQNFFIKGQRTAQIRDRQVQMINAQNLKGLEIRTDRFQRNRARNDRAFQMVGVKEFGWRHRNPPLPEQTAYRCPQARERSPGVVPSMGAAPWVSALGALEWLLIQHLLFFEPRNLFRRIA